MSKDENNVSVILKLGIRDKIKFSQLRQVCGRIREYVTEKDGETQKSFQENTKKMYDRIELSEKQKSKETNQVNLRLKRVEERDRDIVLSEKDTKSTTDDFVRLMDKQTKILNDNRITKGELRKVKRDVDQAASKSDIKKIELEAAGIINIEKEETEGRVVYTIGASVEDKGGGVFVMNAPGSGTAGTGEANTASNVGLSGLGVYDSKTGVDLRFRKISSLHQGLRVTLGSSGTVDLGMSLNSDYISEGVSNFYHRGNRFTAGTGVSVITNGVTVVIQANGTGAAGEVNTASNIGVSGQGFYNSKDGVDLEFKKLSAITQDIQVTAGSSGTVNIGTTNILSNYDTNDLSEGTSSFYYTEARFNSSFGNKGTNDLSEGSSNFYYVPTRIYGQTGVTVYVSGLTVQLSTVDSVIDHDVLTNTHNLTTDIDHNLLTNYAANRHFLESDIDTDNVIEGASGLFYSGVRFDSSFGAKDTNDLGEGASGLYYSHTRFNTAFAAKGSDDLSEGTSALYYSQQRFNTAFGAKDSDDLSEGTSALYYSQQRFDSAVQTDDLDLFGINFVLGSGATVIGGGVKGYVEVPFNGTISSVRLLAKAGVTGTLTVDIWNDVYGSYPPTDADTITGSSPMKLVDSIKGEETGLGGWSTGITAGDILGINVDGCTTITQATLSIRGTKG